MQNNWRQGIWPRSIPFGQQSGFKFLEDASHAIGGKYQGEPIGNSRYSDITVLSFQPVKIITTGESGMALTSDTQLAKRMQLLRSHGITRDVNEMTHAPDGPWYYQQIDLEYNYRLLKNNSGDMVGGGLFNYSSMEGVYAVGVYDRSLFDKPLGHVVQYRAIEELKKRDVKWYKIGTRPYSSDAPAPTDKEISIAKFKQWFASHVFPHYVLTHKVIYDKNTC